MRARRQSPSRITPVQGGQKIREAYGHLPLCVPMFVVPVWNTDEFSAIGWREGGNACSRARPSASLAHRSVFFLLTLDQPRYT